MLNKKFTLMFQYFLLILRVLYSESTGGTIEHNLFSLLHGFNKKINCSNV